MLVENTASLLPISFLFFWITKSTIKLFAIVRGEPKKPKFKTKLKNRKNQTEEPINRIEFYKIFGLVNRTDFFSGSRFGFGSGGRFFG